MKKRKEKKTPAHSTLWMRCNSEANQAESILHSNDLAMKFIINMPAAVVVGHFIGSDDVYERKDIHRVQLNNHLPACFDIFNLIWCR